ncbi:MAG: sugar transferase [Anaerolineae bacterium]|nr:sugar transferase [Anaerolineae bacterium]
MNLVRRLFDLALALLSLILAAPLLLLIAILIKLDSPGPVLNTPEMIGRDGKRFRLRRFRTMSPARPGHTIPEERLTRAGRFVRNYSLDHLPTLFNVVTGDLALVGPRPMEPEFVDLADPTWQRYFSIRPGLFNYAVLKLGRTFGPSSAGNLPRKLALEMEYIDQQSLWYDLQLLARFARAHLASRGNVKARGAPDCLEE